MDNNQTIDSHHPFSVQTQHPLANRCYTMSEPHLSGWQLVIGFNTMEEMQAAQEFISKIPQKTKGE